MRRVLAAAAVHLEPRVVAVLFLGFSSGIPLALTGQTLSVWLRETGVSLTVIGLFALVGLPYVLKFLWAPVIDAVPVPVLTRLLGRRRGWLIATQLALLASVVALGGNDPLANPFATALLALVVAFCSASQDVVVDAFRVESLEKSQFAAGMANYVAGYRVALLVSTAGAFELASLLQHGGLAGRLGWAATYAAMAALVLAGSIAVLLSKEPEHAPPSGEPQGQTLGKRLLAAAVDPLRDFLRRPDWLAILLFVMLFKFADAVAGVMTAPFVLDIGFDKTDYGRIVKLFGFAATLIGGFAGGALYRVAGERPSLWIAGILQGASNLMFVWQAQAGPDLNLLIATIGVENLSGGLGTVVFVAYLSGLCRNRAYTATQYAMLSAVSAVGRTVLSASSGWIADRSGWTAFFLLTTVAAVPGLILLAYLGRPRPLPPGAQST
jgi:MFS transporter, PAT family, beta-lactamase induction signal transducer AmpG